MVFWSSVAILAALVTLALVRPLLRPVSEAEAPRTGDIEVFKDQLKEIDADLERGTITSIEAEAAKTEVSRRLLRAAQFEDGKSAPEAAPQTGLALKLSYAVMAFLPLASLAIYVSNGAPYLPAQPLSARLAAPVERSSTGDLIAKVEARLRENPDDGRGWEVIAPVYMAQRDYAKAAEAFQNVMRISGETADRLYNFADARIRSQNGLVPDDARAALKSSLAKDPAKKEARIWLAIAKEQNGDLKGAADDFRALIAEAPDSPWRTALETRLAAIDPSVKKVEPPAAASAAGGDQQAMINTMVDRLAERLKTDGKDADGWAKLIRSYSVLGRADEAAKALAKARENLAGDAASLKAIDELAQSLGLKG